MAWGPGTNTSSKKVSDMAIFKVSKNVNGRVRYSILGVKGFVAKRKRKSRGWGIERQRTFTQLHMGKLSLAVEVRNRHTYNFAG